MENIRLLPILLEGVFELMLLLKSVFVLLAIETILLPTEAVSPVSTTHSFPKNIIINKNNI